MFHGCRRLGKILALLSIAAIPAATKAQAPAFRRCPSYTEAVGGGPPAGGIFRGAQCIELELRTPLDPPSGVKPYRDYALSISLSRPGSNPGTVTGVGYWDGGKIFRFRTALPAPDAPLTSQTWSWSTACKLTASGAPCSASLGLAASGSVSISSYPGNASPEIYRKGFLRTVGQGTNRKPYLTYADGTTPFPWLGDTAWEAPVKEALTADAAKWISFLDDRKLKGFTVVLVAPAPIYGNNIPVRGFTISGSCADPVPNACTTPDFAYWRRFEALVEEANRRGLVVAVLGLIDPVDRGGLDKIFPDQSNPYPKSAEAVRFAGYLAARLSGNHVVFSPGYDDQPWDVTYDGVQVSSVMNSVGAEIKRVAPRHLIGNHLAGGAQDANYSSFESNAATAWLSFHLFHSGHAIKVSNGCPTQTSLTRQQCAVKRARELPAGFRGRKWPSANGEGAYDFPATPNSPPPDNRYGARHTGYASLLSGAFGFTFGSDKVFNWTAPAGVLNSDGAKDMVILGKRIRALPWQNLVPRTELIKNNPAASEQKMYLAATADNKALLAYLPNNLTIEIDTSLTPKLSCSPLSSSSTWSIFWYSASDATSWDGRSTDLRGPGCTNASGKVILRRPNCTISLQTAGAQGGCDWVVELRDTRSSASANAAVAPADRALEVTARSGDEEAPAAILAKLSDVAGNSLVTDIVVSEATDGDQKLPVSARDASGVFWVVWQAGVRDGDGYGIFARRYDSQGAPLGGVFQVNTWSDGDQTDPAVSADAAGHVVIVWTSHGQDGDLGGIFGQRFGSSGQPLGNEFQVPTQTAGHQAFPQVMADTLGNFVVAWDSEGTDGDGKGVYYRRFDATGSPQGNSARVNTTWLGDQAFSNLQVEATGEITIEWAGYDDLGDLAGIYVQRYQRDGTPVNGETLTVIPPPDES